jgi:hypothetical protein
VLSRAARQFKVPRVPFRAPAGFLIREQVGEQVRKLGRLLKSIETSNVGLRVRAISGILAHTFCSRAGALSMLRCADFHDAGDLWMLRRHPGQKDCPVGSVCLGCTTFADFFCLPRWESTNLNQPVFYLPAD